MAIRRVASTPPRHTMITRSKKVLEEEEEEEGSVYTPSQDSDTESENSDNESVFSDDSLVEIFPQFGNPVDDEEDEEEEELDLRTIRERDLYGDLRKRVIEALRIEIKRGLRNIDILEGSEYKKAACITLFDYLHLHLAKLRVLGKRFAKRTEEKLSELARDQSHDTKFVRRIHFYQESMANWFHWAGLDEY